MFSMFDDPKAWEKHKEKIQKKADAYDKTENYIDDEDVGKVSHAAPKTEPKTEPKTSK